jgi:hypothetical protein
MLEYLLLIPLARRVGEIGGWRMYARSDIDKYSGYIVGVNLIIGNIVAQLFDERFKLLVVVAVTVSLTALLRWCGKPTQKKGKKGV